MTIRVLYNYILHMLGMREMLPGDILRSKPIHECNEPMVAITPGGGIFFEGEELFCRRSVADRLRNVAAGLSGLGLGLYIYELYRSPEQQKARHQATYRRYCNEFSDKEELEKHVRRSTAGVGGGHQTGGAVDLSLCDAEGSPLDMGSKYPDKCPQMVTSYRLPTEITERRRLLCKAMRKEGFANYPAEWWHFAYGDQLWAAYRHRRHAIYGPLIK